MSRQHRLLAACVVTAGVFLAELIGGIVYGSISLIADSFHVIVDVMALLTSFMAIRMVLRPNWAADYTFGYHRLEILAALFNAGTLGVTIFLIIQESIKRLLEPGMEDAGMVLLIASIGLVANLVSARLLGQGHHHAVHDHDGHGHGGTTHDHGETGGDAATGCPASCNEERCLEDDLNMKSARLHVLGDALSSVVVIAGAIIIHFTDLAIIDPILAFCIAGILLKNTYGVLKGSLTALMSKSPVNVQTVQAFLERIPGVTNVHDLHVWRLCSKVAMLTAHVKLDVPDLASAERAIDDIEARLLERFAIQHVTIQAETPGSPVKCCNIQHD